MLCRANTAVLPYHRQHNNLPTASRNLIWAPTISSNNCSCGQHRPCTAIQPDAPPPSQHIKPRNLLWTPNSYTQPAAAPPEPEKSTQTPSTQTSGTQSRASTRRPRRQRRAILQGAAPVAPTRAQQHRTRIPDFCSGHPSASRPPPDSVRRLPPTRTSSSSPPSPATSASPLPTPMSFPASPTLSSGFTAPATFPTKAAAASTTSLHQRRCSCQALEERLKLFTTIAEEGETAVTEYGDLTEAYDQIEY